MFKNLRIHTHRRRYGRPRAREILKHLETAFASLEWRIRQWHDADIEILNVRHFCLQRPLPKRQRYTFELAFSRTNQYQPGRAAPADFRQGRRNMRQIPGVWRRPDPADREHVVSRLQADIDATEVDDRRQILNGPRPGLTSPVRKVIVSNDHHTGMPHDVV